MRTKCRRVCPARGSRRPLPAGVVVLANRGAGPLELYGVVNSTTGETDAYQVVYHDNGARLTYHVGTFSFAGHATHNHWHFDEFAKYELRNASTGALVASSDKVSFCLLDLDDYSGSSMGRLR